MSDVVRHRAALMGWPQAEKPSLARVLDLLLESPCTVQDIRSKLSISRWTAQEYLDELWVKGLVKHAGRQPQPRTKPRTVWQLAEGVGKRPPTQ